MSKRPFDHINSEAVLDKYLTNKRPKRRELYHWLVDLPFLIESSRGADEDIQSFACFYLDTALPYIDKALKRKYGFKDAVHFINYNVMNSIHGDSGLSMNMDIVIKMEEKQLKEVLKFLKGDKRFH
jgi:hypothetical protein